MDFGDYAYIIFLILGAIFSAFNKKKKKNRKEAKPTSDPTSRPSKPNVSVSFEDLINKLNDQMESPAPVTPPSPVIERVKKREEPRRAQMEKVEVEKKSAKTTKPSPSQTVLEVKSEHAEDEDSHFDLRQAVIYSEILKRPYE